jgi:hypothetical protein
MRADSPFIVELFRTAPLGPVLQLIAIACLVTLVSLIDTERPATTVLKVIWFVMFVSGVLGMHLTHKASVKLQAQRHARRVERSIAPWDIPKGD